MSNATKINDQLKRHGSNGAKTATCVVCQGTIQPYAGRPVSLYTGRFAHHPGQCQDTEKRSATLRELAGQGELFAWQCRHVEPAGDIPAVCNELGADRTAFELHLRSHGATALKVPARIKLRKTAPAAKLGRPIVNPFKWLGWTENGTDRKGQYWSDGPDPQSVWVVPLHPAPWETPGKPAKPVLLYSHGDGTWSTDWSKAKWDRRDANRRAKRNAA